MSGNPAEHSLVVHSLQQIMTNPVELVGRRRERRLLDAVIDAVAMYGTALVLWGDPGVGKSTMLDYVAGRAGVRVLRARGVESEAELPYAALADLLIPMRRFFAEVPATQRCALEGSLALGSGGPINPYAVCAAALNVLAAASETEPLILLVDDLQWIDRPSQQVLLFVARRLASERVGLVLSARDDPELRARCDVPGTLLEGLSLPECTKLLHRRGLRVSPAVMDVLVGETGGNPLALLEWASTLRSAQLIGLEPVDRLLVPGRILDDAWSALFHPLPHRTLNALVVVAASRSSTVDLLAAALGVVGLGLADLAPAEASRIVVTDDVVYEFRHPLLRTAVLRQTPYADRLVAFRALAEVTTGTARAWYRAAAVLEPDDNVAEELVTAAREARQRSGYGAAALAWHRAAELTTSLERRGELLIEAASDASISGSAGRAIAWCDEGLAVVSDPARRADLELLRGRVRTWIGQTTAAHEGLVAAAAEVRAYDIRRACALFSEAVLPAALDGLVAKALEVSAEGMTLAEAAGITDPRSWIAHGQSQVLAGRVADGLRLIDRAGERIANADPITDQHLLTLIGQTYAYCEQPDRARSFITPVIDEARRRSLPSALPFALSARSELEFWAGRLIAAEADATESLRWSQELGQVTTLGYSHACLARVYAVRGDRAHCEDHIARARTEAGPYGLPILEAYMTDILGLAALTHGDYEVAATQLERTFDLVRQHEVGNPMVVPFAANLVEAYARVGRPRRAQEALAWIGETADQTGLDWARAVWARCQGLLATELGEAERHFTEAESWHRRQSFPFELARTLLCRGETMRRLRRPAAARAPLTAAHAIFQSIGATPWARRAAAETAAAGQRATVVAPSSALESLSPQEVQVARAIASGMNNVEAAGALFISRKTVEAHLTRVYRKLGIRSRTDLTRAIVSAGLLD